MNDGRWQELVRSRWVLSAPWALSALGIAALSCADLDARLVEPFYDPGTRSWPLKRSFLWKRVLHDGARDAVLLVGLAALAVWIASLFWERLRPRRRGALFLVLAVALPALIAGWVKHHSGVPCPWESTRFGGPWAHGPPYWPRVAGGEGQCWPGAHASGGFAMMAWFFLLRDARPRAALAALAAGYLLGHAFGVVQVVRGAHFPSHAFATALLVWTALLLLERAALRPRRARPPSRGSERAGP